MPPSRDHCSALFSSGLLPISLLTDGDRLLGPPSDQHLAPAMLELLRGGGLEILADDLKFSPGLELDPVAGHHPRVGDVADPAPFGVEPLSVLPRFEELDLLRAH